MGTEAAEWVPLLADLASPLVSAVAGLGGVFLGGWLTTRSERRRQRREFITKQLDELYGPLVSMRAEIRALSELRVRIERASDTTWREKAQQASTAGPEHTERFMEAERPKYDALLADENARLKDVLIPTYRRMLCTFRDRLWLAAPETRAYFPALVEFVDVWERNLRNAIPGDVVQELGHTERNLHLFYEHLEKEHERLREDLSK